MKPWDWGWGAVEALGVWAAFCGAIVAVRLEFAAKRSRDTEDKRRNDDERRSHAAEIAIWPSDPFKPDEQVAPRNVAYRRVTIRNSSAQPVTEVLIFFRDAELGSEETYFGPGLAVLEPGESHEFSPPADMQIGAVQHGKQPKQLKIQFTDSQGRRWERDGAGGLRLVHEPV